MMSDADLGKTDNDPAEEPAGANASQNDQSGATSPDVVPLTDPAKLDASTLAIELEAANDRVLRAQAQLENFRKRTRRELDDQRRYANLPLLADLLPVVDNLHRAVEAAEQTDATLGLLEGVKMVSGQLLAVLGQHGCRLIEAQGAAFDPNLHEAIGKEPSAETAEGIVTRVTRDGYQLHDRVVRPPQVLISAGLPVDDSDAPREFETDETSAE